MGFSCVVEVIRVASTLLSSSRIPESLRILIPVTTSLVIKVVITSAKIDIFDIHVLFLINQNIKRILLLNQLLWHIAHILLSKRLSLTSDLTHLALPRAILRYVIDCVF